MNIIIYIYILIALLIFFMGFYTILKSSGTLTSRYFFAIALFLSLWVLSLIPIIYVDQFAWDAPAFIARLPFALIILFSGAFLLFSLTFPENSHKWKRRDSMISVFTSAVFFVVLTPAVISGFGIDAEGVIYPILGPAFILFPIFLAGAAFFSMIVLFHKYSQVGELHRFQLRHFMFGLFFLLIGGTLTNLILSIVFLYRSTYVFGPFFAVVFLATLLYSISRYRFLATRVVFRKAAFMGVILVIFISVAVVGIFLLNDRLSLPVAFTLVILYSVGLVAIVKRIKKVIDGIFFFEELDLSKNLSEDSSNVSACLRLETYVLQLSAEIQTDVHMDVIAVFVTQRQHNRLWCYYSKKMQRSISLDSPAIAELIQEENYIFSLNDNLKHVSRLMKKVGGSTVLSIRDSENFFGLIFLGMKQDEVQISEKDLKILMKIQDSAVGEFRAHLHLYETLVGLKRKLNNAIFEV